ncbi:MAG: class I mannose-6-phosphate isomerase [Candidatus Eremiobacteraeota bacterium]|nr:class I mannose-6-phosphate isomerase [Candidatus Eremiobacteraeota bacterium]MBV8435469.1 class I mannose-6-phosphate isomerase [Candidatus Eremiobacteraeota bacterium]MBV8721907.1 class I mannose-6-phosphate isomerase [Candidatus Eremiobacteraeota bacterium]
METTIYPYVLDPKLAPAIWGGNELVTEFGKRGDPNAKLGESWECWDANAVIDGALAKSTVAELRGKLGPKLLGDLDPARIFPVLTKIITAHDWLSVQVHPDDAYAQRVEHQPNGKTECWYVFSAEPNAELVLGWSRDTSREEYERRVADGTLGDILRRIPVKAGDTIYIPAGMVHAIGAGVVLFETQQASDLTYRMFDWNRVGADGKPRELHVQKAADVLDYRQGTAGALLQVPYFFEGMERTALIADPRFVVERIAAGPEPASLASNGRPLILMSLDAKLEVTCDDVTVTLEPYQTTLVAASCPWCTVRSPGECSPFMMVTPPADRELLPVRLLAAGVEQSTIDRFMEQFSGPVRAD